MNPLQMMAKEKEIIFNFSLLRTSVLGYKNSVDALTYFHGAFLVFKKKIVLHVNVRRSLFRYKISVKQFRIKPSHFVVTHIKEKKTVQSL